MCLIDVDSPRVFSYYRDDNKMLPCDIMLFGRLTVSVVTVCLANVSEGCLQGFPSLIIRPKFHLNSQRMIGLILGISPFFSLSLL